MTRNVGWILLLAMAIAAPLGAAVTLQQVRDLPALPDPYTDETSFTARVAWLEAQLAGGVGAAERYRLQRALFEDHYFEGKMADASALCVANPPLPDDVRYRRFCTLAVFPEYEDHLPRLVALVDDARRIPDLAEAARVLSDVAWRQSQAGDIGSAFENFEAALSTAPADEDDLLADIMMDTAVSYIVNGDPTYIRKGIELLREAREHARIELDDAEGQSDKALLRDRILLSEFNTGIAYLLHLSDNAKALEHFAQVAREPNPYRLDALVFAALAAAESGQTRQARAYLARADREDGSRAGPVVQKYLECYRQMAVRHWEPRQPLSACLELNPQTTLEVKLDVYKRLSGSDDPAIALAGLKGLKALFIDTFEPQFRRRAAIAASNAELTRLQRESELKSLVLKQQRDLQRERDATNTQRQRYFVATSLLLLAGALLVALQWRAKKRLADQFERMSVVDPLTGLGNRRFLEQHIGRELSQIERARRSDPEVSLGIYLFDIDHFKSINDRFGHNAGDDVLAAFSRRVQAATRQTDLLVRWGGEEFLLMARLQDESHCRQLAERILSAIRDEPFAIPGHTPIAVTCTIGAVRYPFLGGESDGHGSASWSRLVRLADMALYHGKSAGRNRWIVVDNARIASVEALDAVLASSLEAAADDGWIDLSTP